MNNKHKELEFDKFYLCGQRNDRSSYWCFERENVKESAIKFELFTASSHENVIQDLEDILKLPLWWMTKKPLLKCLKTNHTRSPKTRLRCPYSCQGGICSSCLARVTWEAEMAKNSILTDGEIASGLVLTCQAHPTSETIYVDYDDV
jgi:ring-1,2-phenylacetyl-CoA epoxidase subunit PaaE